MTRATKYVALDVHQATTAVSVRAETGQVIARTIVPTETQAITEFFRGMRGAVPVGFEEGTQAQWLHDLLVPVVQRVVVCDRHGEKRRGNKGDRVDADGLSARPQALWPAGRTAQSKKTWGQECIAVTPPRCTSNGTAGLLAFRRGPNGRGWLAWAPTDYGARPETALPRSVSGGR